MATSSGQDAKAVIIPGVDLLLHPELMSEDFMQLVLREVSEVSRETHEKTRGECDHVSL